MPTAEILPLFAYGTLLPGEIRWPFLAPFAVDKGVADTACGLLFDTGQGFPAAVFGVSSSAATSRVHGRVFTLVPARYDDALLALDDVEGAADGGYRRVRITTGSGAQAWAYEYGGGLELVEIPGGSWLDWPH